MAFQGISTGSGPNIGDGDTLFSGAIKINSNFSEVYNALGDGTTISSTVEPDNVNTGIVTATEVDVNGKAEVDNIRIDGNEIDTTSGNLTLDSSDGTVTVDDDLNVSGTSSFTGVSTFSSLVEVIDDEGLYIKTETNSPSTGARIRFSDKTSSTGGGPFSQFGQIKYRHSNDAVVSGYADGFVISGTEVETALKLEGDFFVDNVGISTNLTVDGNTTLGNENTDTITATARFNSALVPSADGTYDLGASTLEWRDLYIDGTAKVDTLEVDLNATVEGTTNLNGDVNLGNATSDTITATGRFDSALVPSVDGTYDLGASTLEWRDLYIDGTAKVDTLEVDLNATVEGTTNLNGDVNLGNATSDTITATGRFDSALVPSADGTYDLGTSSIEWRDLYIDGTAKVDTLEVDLNATVAGSLSVNGGVNLGNDTTDTITATGRFDSDLVPSTDNARSLGATGLEWRNLFIDNVAKIDTLNVDGNALVEGTTNLNGPVVLGDELTDGTTVSGNLTVNGSSSLKQLDVVSDDGLYIKSVTNSAAEGARIRFSDKTSTTAFSQFGQIKYRHADNAIESGYNDGFLISGSESPTVVKVDGDIVATNIKSTGNITVEGTTNLNGDVNLGNATTDTITAAGRFDNRLVPSADGTYDLGASTLEWRDLYIDGTAKVDTLTVDENATVTGTLNANGAVNLGNATTDTITATGRFDSALVPSADGTYDLGTSTIEWRDLYIDGTAKVDTLTVDASATITQNLTVNGNTTLGNADTDTITATGRFDSDLVPSSDNARSLGAVGLEWRNLFIDNVANIDTLNVNNTLLVTGNTNLNGSVALGNEDTDNVTINGKVNSNIVPLVDDTYDLGTSTIQWRNLYINGTAKVDTLTVDASATITSNLNVNGNTTLGNASTDFTTINGSLSVLNSASVTGTFTANGDVNLGNATDDNITITGRVNSSIVPDGNNAYDLGTSTIQWRNLYIDGTASIDTLTVDANATIKQNLLVEGNTTLGNASTDIISIVGSVGILNSTTVTGTFTANGDVNLGSATDDNITITGRVNSSIVPDGDDAYDLGTSTLQWRNLYINGTATIDTLTVDGSATVKGTLNANDDVNLGDSDTDTITVTGRFDSDLLPITDNVYDLGSNTRRWHDLWVQGKADVETLEVDSNATVIGTLNAQGGYYIGISSAGQSITTGPIKTLNFIGAGNTFAYNASTDTIDISIAGGGGGISADNVPTINQVTLSEANTSGARFTGKSFNVNVDMFADGIPISQKGVKGKITGAFQTYDEAPISGNSITSTIQQQGLEWSSRPDAWVDALFQNANAADDFNTYLYFARIVTKPTTKGGGAGAGYYMVTVSNVYDAATNGYIGVHNVLYTQDLGAQTPPSLLHNQTKPAVYVSNRGAVHYTNNICIEGDIVWCEKDHVFYGTNGNSYDYHPFPGIAWRDSSGVQAKTNNSAQYFGAQATSDGECAYHSGWNGSNIVIGFCYPSGTGFVDYSFDNLISATTLHSHAICYHKQSNRLLVLAQFENEVFLYAWEINSGTVGNAAVRLGNLTVTSQFTGATNGTFTSVYDSDINIEQMTYCGIDGTYLIYNGVPYKYSSNINKFVATTSPTSLSGVQPQMRIHGNGDGTIYLTEKRSGSTDGYSLYSSTDQGSTWSTIFSTGFDVATNSDIFPYLGIGLGEIYWTRGGHMFETDTSDSFLAMDYCYKLDYLQQTLTIGSGNVSKFPAGSRISLKSDVNNSDYIGIVESTSTSTISINSNEPYPTSGDSVVNLDTPISTLEADRYIVLNGAGDISSLSLTDPGFVTRTNGTEFSVKFPTQFTNGVPPDTDIPAGAFLQITVEATNQSGTDEAFSNNVQPS